MAWDAEFDELLPHTITLRPKTGQDADRKPTYGAAVESKARIELKSRLIRTAEGAELMGRGTVFAPLASVPSTEDELTLPAGFAPLKPPIMAVLPQYDEDGLHHVEIVIG